MKKIQFLYAMLGLLSLYILHGCSKEKYPASSVQLPVPAPPTGQPSITSITPNSGAGMIQISIYGQNFGRDITKDTLWFSNGQMANINIVTDTLIMATVPANVATGGLTLSVYGNKINGPVFNYVPFVMSYTIGYSSPTTYAGTLGTSTSADGTPGTFRAPRGAAISKSTGVIYVCDMSDNIIRVISTAGAVTTIGAKSTGGSTNGTLTTATFNAPRGIAVDNAGNLIVVETAGNRVRKVNLTAGTVTTIAGPGSTGTGATATFSAAQGVAVDSKGIIYVADGGTHTIKRIILDANNNVTSFGIVAGTSGSAGHVDDIGTAAKLYTPLGIAVDQSDNLIVTDYGSHYIRYINTTNWAVTTLAGTGVAGTTDNTNPLVASFNNPAGVAVDPFGNILVTDYASGRLRLITISTMAVTTINASLSNPVGVVTDASGNVYTAGYGNKLVQKFTLSRF